MQITAIAPSVGKRIVLVDKHGDHTIVGREDGDGMLPTVLSVPLPAEGGMEMLHFNLIRVKRRFALYREIVPPATSRLNETFDPAQV